MTLTIARNESVRRKFGREAAEDSPQWTSPWSDPARYPPLRVDAVEHEVRSLLNLVGLISHCLRTCQATELERAQWRREAERANKRLRRLRAAGWYPRLLR